MMKAPQYATIGALLATMFLLGPACDESAGETVTPVQIAPGDQSPVPPASSIEQLRVRVVAKYPHARDAFTQGLLWHDGAMYESTGRYGQSSLRRVRLEDGEVLAERSLDPTFFGEGLALVDDRLVQLTWRSGVAVVSDVASLEQQELLHYPGEGWGLCFDGTALVMSDGSSILELREPENMELLREMTVWRGDRTVRKLNELECVGDDIYANVWQSNEIVRIDAKTGHVNAVIDASGLLTLAESVRADVLNGIAYKPDTDTFLLTGKLWPHVFEVELIAR
jgi:glutamine cyclotransferase